jgi:Transposase DDE domain
VDGDLLDGVIGAWRRTRTCDLAGRRVIAVDGKSVRGARNGEQSAPHLVAALDSRLRVVLGQVKVGAKSNEIPALRTLLEAFDLTGVVVTAGAMQ